MARIYWEFAKYTFSEYPDSIMLFLFAATVFSMVSINQVFMNMPKENFIMVYNFLVAAFLRTSWIIQVLITGFFLRITIEAVLFAYRGLVQFSKKYREAKIKSLSLKY